MISIAEFEIALRGLLRLARFDAGFSGFFDLSKDGARRSFLLALPLLPINLLLFNLNVTWPDGSDPMRIWCGHAFKMGPKVFGAVAVYNWLSVLSIAIQLPISIAIRFGFDPTIGAVLSEGGVIFITACEFFAFKRLLGIAFEAALALAIADFVIGWVLVQELIVPLAIGQI
jgi:hypothetical protein